MKLHEYQAKEIFARYGIPVARSEIASTPAEAKSAAERLGGKVVVKAQVHAGGRGKAGGVKLVANAAEAESAAAGMLGRNLVTHQTTARGVPVRKVLIAETTPIATELYLAVTVDGDARAPVIMGSRAGGMDIETVAAEHPERIIRVKADPSYGIWPYGARDMARALGFPPKLVREAADLILNLYRVFVDNDCTLAEINPLVITTDGRVVAVDSKLNIEDDALFRHADLKALADPEQQDELQRRAEAAGVKYVKLENGRVGCMVNGAGLAMATMDITEKAGTPPANFLDVGGSANEDRIAEAFKLLVSDADVRAIFVNIFGGILRCDIAARGVVQGARESGSRLHIVALLRGTNAEDGRRILADSGLKVTFLDDLSQAGAAVAATLPAQGARR
ncbi:MAG: ADP-forming succinate--CoA ligase subunit beta [Chloroflexi bacterium]|nr:ADP-forming succinate--CoA ligase subunit beta [Chloroflexota bacterium]